LNDHAFRIVATFELQSAGKRKTRKVLEPATWIEQATCGLRMETGGVNPSGETVWR